MLQQLKRLIFNYDWEVVEIEGAVFKVLWGFWILLPWNSFGNFPTNVFAVFGKLGPEWVIGLGVMLLGLAHLYAIGFARRPTRRNFILVAFMFWLFTSVCFGMARIGSAMIPFTLVICFFLAVNYFRLGIPVIDMGRQKPR